MEWLKISEYFCFIEQERNHIKKGKYDSKSSRPKEKKNFENKRKSFLVWERNKLVETRGGGGLCRITVLGLGRERNKLVETLIKKKKWKNYSLMYVKWIMPRKKK